MANNDKQSFSNLTGSETWFVMGVDKIIFGPVPTRVLYQWAAENRITVGCRVSTDKSNWEPAESLPLLKMEWVANLPGGKVIGPFNILAVPHLFNRNILPGDATLVNRSSGKTIPVHDLVARVPSQNTSDDPFDKDGTPRPPVASAFPEGITPAPLSSPPAATPPPTPAPVPAAPAAATPAPATPPAKPAPVAPAKPAPVVPEPVQEKTPTPSAAAPATQPAGKKPAPSATQRQQDADGPLRRELDRIRKELSEKVIQLESFVRRAETAEDQFRLLTEKSAEREAGLKKEVELLKKEFVATQREAMQAPAPTIDINALQDQLQAQRKAADDAANREKALRTEQDSLTAQLASIRAELEQQRAENEKHRKQSQSNQDDSARSQKSLNELSRDLEAARVALGKAEAALSARDATQPRIEQLTNQLAASESARMEREAKVAALSADLTQAVSQRDAANTEIKRLTAELASHESLLTRQREDSSGKINQLDALQVQLSKRDDALKQLERQYQEFRETSATRIQALNTKSEHDEQAMDKFRGELAESRKRQAELKAAQATVQAEVDKTRSESTRLILQHQAKIKALETEKDELTSESQEMEAALKELEHENARIKASSSAMGQLQKQEAESLREQLAEARLSHQDSNATPSPERHEAPPEPDAATPAPAQNQPIPADIKHLQEEWNRERAVLESRLDEAVRRSVPLAAPSSKKGIYIATAIALLCIALGFWLGKDKNQNSPIEDVIGHDVLAELGEDLFQPTTNRTSSTSKASPTPARPRSTVEDLPPIPPIKPITMSPWPEIKSKGCYVLSTDTSCRIILNQGLFSSSTNFAPDALEILADLAQALAGKIDGYDLIILGHTDDTPVAPDATYADNERLGLSRAEMVRQVLIDQFAVEAGNVHILSTGEINAPYPNNSDESRLRNRTVTFELKRSNAIPGSP